MSGSGYSPASVDYDTLATRYDRHRTGDGPYIDALVAHARACDAKRILELGAGTGNVSNSFFRRHPCELLCLERSASMLATARSKRAPGSWLRADASVLPFADSSFDLIYSVFMVHHIRDIAALFDECARVTKRSIATVTTTHHFIESHPMITYFPSFAAIDKARFQTTDQIENAMHAAGFVNIESSVHRGAPTPIDSRYADKVENRFISTFDLIPDDEFHAGLARLRADIATGNQPPPTAWECAYIAGVLGN